MSTEEKSNPQNIEAGEAVFHVSNTNFTMAVDWVEGDEAECSWVDAKGVAQSKVFKVATLRKISKNSGASDISVA